MNLVFNVFQISAPVFFLAAIGFIWVKLGFEYKIEFVTRLAMTLALPCLIFVALMNTNISSDTLWAICFATIGAYAFVTIICFLLVKITKLDITTFLAPLTFGNTGNLGLPLSLIHI